MADLETIFGVPKRQNLDCSGLQVQGTRGMYLYFIARVRYLVAFALFILHSRHKGGISDIHPSAFIVITSSPTPNPNSLKFEANGRSFIEDGLIAAFSPDEVKDNALASRLFALPGVESLLITPEFVTVSKHVATNWEQLAEAVKRVLEEWLEEV